MKRHAWHATRHPEKILASGYVKPSRLACVYLFDTFEGAAFYGSKFGCDHVCEVVYDTHDVAGVWHPSYAGGAKVIRLKRGRMAKHVASFEV